MSEQRLSDDADRVLLQALQAGDDVEGSFRELFLRYRRRLLAFFSKKGFDSDVGRELSQETFLRVYRSRRRFRGDVPLSSWILRIADNVIKNELRRQAASKRSGHEKPLDDEDESQPIEVHTGGVANPTLAAGQPLARALAREKVEALRHALQRLPPRMRQVMQLRVHHEYSVAEIAAVLKITESTVKVQLHEARKRLRQILEDRFDGPLF